MCSVKSFQILVSSCSSLVTSNTPYVKNNSRFLSLLDNESGMANAMADHSNVWQSSHAPSADEAMTLSAAGNAMYSNYNNDLMLPTTQAAYGVNSMASIPHGAHHQLVRMVLVT